jgi:ATP-binding cassette subfamily B multidrug efflux pump
MSSPLKRLGKKYAAPQWRWYLGGTLALIVTNIIVLEIPQLAKEIINALATGNSLSTYTTLSLVIIGLGLTQVLIRTASRMLIFWPGRTLEASIKDDVFTHILRVPMSLLAPFSIGDLTSRLNNDVTQLRIFFAFGALQVLNVIFISIFTVTKMASIDPVLTMLAIFPMIPMLLLTKVMMPRLYKAMRESTEAMGRLTGKISETFAQAHMIQVMNAQSAMISRTRPDTEAIYEANIRTVWIRTLIWPVMTILIGLSQFATLAWGGKQIIAGQLSVGDIMAFNIYIGMLTFPFASLGIILNVYQRAKPASERLEDLSGLSPEHAKNIQEASDQIPTKTILAVKNLSFAWPDGRPCLSEISFTVRPGERVGIFGNIGCGKSTLFNIITRLIDHSQGEVLLNGKSILTMPPSDVRRSIAYGLQQPLLFSESVRSNLCLGLPDESTSTERLEKATRMAQVYDDIMRLPETWDTPIGEKGIKLSGGQKQRLALARLLLRPAEMIILDDVLSAVDHDTEHRLIHSLLETKSALLIASHRVSILEPCDKVLVMRDGRIIGSGSYGDVRSLIETISLEESDAKPLNQASTNQTEVRP